MYEFKVMPTLRECFYQVQQGQVQVVLGVDEIYTLTTITTGQKGQHPPPPDSAPFPENYFAFFYGKYCLPFFSLSI